jgi:hypothetical protein
MAHAKTPKTRRRAHNGAREIGAITFCGGAKGTPLLIAAAGGTDRTKRPDASLA